MEDSLSPEEARIAALHRLEIMRTPREQRYDDIVQLAAHICDTPIALISLVDRDHQWFKACVGLSVDQTSRDVSFCSYAIVQEDLDKVFVIPDATKDPRFCNNPLVTGPPHIRMYAGAPLVTSDGHALGSLCVIDNKPRDLTDRQLKTLQVLGRSVVAQMELRQSVLTAEAASSAKSEFLARMSHEIRTPLNGVIGIAEILLCKGGLGEAQLRHVNMIKTSADTLLTLINDILDFSKIEAGKLEMDCIDFDPRRIVDEVVEMLAAKAQGKGLGFFSQIAAGIPPRLRGDPDRLRQVVINLANNAIKFTPAGEVVVKVQMEGADAVHPALRFAVSDTGVGIPADRLDRLFKSFSQVDASTTRQFGGTGLGLAIAKQLVGLMQGEIGVDSVPGRGSTFWFVARFLPASGVEPPVTASPVDCPRADSKQSVRILLAEDNEINQEVAAGILEHSGYRVDVVSDGQSAIDAVAAKAYDIVLMDCQMPVLDGYEATRRLRVLEKEGRLGARAMRLPIIALTASAVQGDRQRCLDAGMDGHVTKPIDRHELIVAIQSLVGSGKNNDGSFQPLSQSGSSSLPIDIDLLMDRCMGDAKLAEDMLLLFDQDLPRQIEQLRQELRNHDASAVSDLVHEMKGISGNLSAVLLSTRIVELDALVQKDAWDSALEAMSNVESAIQSCADFLPQAIDGIRQHRAV
jgi:signal transduction histidine kinase/DNA-binding NarL/FixJ family response regulator